MGESLDPYASASGPSPRVRFVPARPDVGSEAAPAADIAERFTGTHPDAGFKPPPIASSTFDAVFAVLIGHEGGYVNHPADPGGETKFGITKRSYPHLNIASLTLDDARSIFRRDFFDALRCGEMPAPLALLVSDAAYHCGPGRSARWLQAALRVSQDGAIGPATLGAIQRWQGKGAELCAEVVAQRMLYLTGLKTWPTFGKGWTRRIAGLAFQAASMRDL